MQKNPSIIRSGILCDFKRVAIANNLDPFALATLVGIHRSYLEDVDLFLPVRQVIELFEVAALSSGIEDFGFRVGEARGIPDLGPAILILREEPTIRQALLTLGDLLTLHSDAISIHLEDGNTPIMFFDIMADGMSHRQVMDAGIAAQTHILRWLLGERWRPLSVSFTHARPRSQTRMEQFFHCPIDFLQDFNGIVFNDGDLDIAIPSSSPVIRLQVERYIKSIKATPSDTYVHRVTQTVASVLARGEGGAEAIANYMGTDVRTLNRRLASSGLNYSKVLNAVRTNLVTQLLLGSDRPLSDMAGLLGFGSLSAFSRWFTSVFGKTPSSWRASHRSRRRYTAINVSEIDNLTS